jgi:CBS domain containing-hemolysin-like protein
VLGLFLAALIILLNGFFVAAEFALVKLRATQLHSRVRRGERSAIAAQAILQRLDRYLSVTQVGITLASLTLGWVGEPAIEALITKLAVRLVGEDLGHAGHFAAIAVAFTILTFGHLLFGELVPKLLAIQRSEGTALFAALPLRFLNIALAPILRVLEVLSGMLLRSMGLRPDSTSEGALSEEEILGILAANTATGPKGHEKSQLVERVLRFAQRTARHAMVPRVDVVSIPINSPPAVAMEVVEAQQFSRVLLTKGRSLDEVAGYLYAKDLIFAEDVEKLTTVAPLRRDVLFVAETQGLIEVLREMQKEHTPIAVVVDEYGGTSGILTMEDLLEEIVGDIRDEFDEEPARIVKVHSEANVWDVDGRAAMEELRSLGVSVDESVAAELLGTVVLEKLGRLPRVGDTVKLLPDVSATVFAMHRRRVARVRVRVEKHEPSPES